MEKDKASSPEASVLSRRTFAGAIGSLGALWGIGSLEGCKNPADLTEEDLRVLAQPLSGTSGIMWADAIGTPAAPLDLRGLIPGSGSTPSNATIVITKGFWTAGDGGGGIFHWDANSAEADNVALVVNPTGNTGNGRWKRLVSDRWSVKWFGAKGDNTTDDVVAIQSAIDLAGTVATHWGLEIYFPKGKYFISTEIHIRRMVILRGAGGTFSIGPTTLRVAAYKHGIVVDNIHTSSDGGDGSCSVISDLCVESSDKNVDAMFHGIWMHTYCRLSNIGVSGFSGHGIYIEGFLPNNSADLFFIENSRIDFCNGWAIYIEGADSNVGVVTRVDSQHNQQGGFYDGSYLGNTFVACHCSACSGPPYKNANGHTTRSVFLGCYSEIGQPPSEIHQPGIVLGGTHGAYFSATSNAQLILGEGTRGGFAVDDSSTPKLYMYQGYSDGRTMYAQMADIDAAPSGFVISDKIAGWNPGWHVWMYNTPLNTMPAFAVSTLRAPIRGSSDAGSILFPRGFYFGPQSSPVKHTLGLFPPTDGELGDIVYNSNPTPGGFLGWVRVTSGGTLVWKTFGAIST